MFNHLSLLSYTDDVAEAPRLSQPIGAHVGLIAAPTLPDTYNGGDWLYRVRAARATDADAAMQQISRTMPTPSHVDKAIFEDGHGGGDWDAPGVYRGLLLSVRPDTPSPNVERFESELLKMPQHITSIRAWRLSRVQVSEGSRPWSHVWEQRYDTLDGLMGPYMMHPYHWGYIDRWFDPESPDWIVDTWLCHSFCRITEHP